MDRLSSIWPGTSIPRGTLVVATTGDSASLAGAVRRAILDVDPDVPVLSLRTIEDAKGRALLLARCWLGLPSPRLPIATGGISQALSPTPQAARFPVYALNHEDFNGDRRDAGRSGPACAAATASQPKVK